MDFVTQPIQVNLVSSTLLLSLYRWTWLVHTRRRSLLNSAASPLICICMSVIWREAACSDHRVVPARIAVRGKNVQQFVGKIYQWCSRLFWFVEKNQLPLVKLVTWHEQLMSEWVTLVSSGLTTNTIQKIDFNNINHLWTTNKGQNLRSPAMDRISST